LVLWPWHLWNRQYLLLYALALDADILEALFKLPWILWRCIQLGFYPWKLLGACIHVVELEVLDLLLGAFLLYSFQDQPSWRFHHEEPEGEKSIRKGVWIVLVFFWFSFYDTGKWIATENKDIGDKRWHKVFLLVHLITEITFTPLALPMDLFHYNQHCSQQQH
jgi:hypothetical protein